MVHRPGPQHATPCTGKVDRIIALIGDSQGNVRRVDNRPHCVLSTPATPELGGVFVLGTLCRAGARSDGTPQAREETGLLGGGVERVITNLGILEFDPQTRSMILAALHPGVTREEVQEKTGFELPISDALKETIRPSEKELVALRGLDPERRYLKEGDF
ncbi:MAG: hypothetical protein IIB03_03230 [Acidobacteria bacterium]|nr:hypothetical protein [Acidobacteriota bacterium]